jgi:hypothetical protein
MADLEGGLRQYQCKWRAPRDQRWVCQFAIVERMDSQIRKHDPLLNLDFRVSDTV